MLGIRNHNRNIYLVNNDYNYTKYLLLLYIYIYII